MVSRKNNCAKSELIGRKACKGVKTLKQLLCDGPEEKNYKKIEISSYFKSKPTENQNDNQKEIAKSPVKLNKMLESVNKMPDHVYETTQCLFLNKTKKIINFINLVSFEASSTSLLKKSSFNLKKNHLNKHNRRYN